MSMFGSLAAQNIREAIEKEIEKAKEDALDESYIHGLEKAKDIAENYEY